MTSPAGRRVLLIDDDATTLQFVDAVLSKAGYEVRTSATMEEVVERLGEAFLSVASNRGAPGPDRQSIEEVREHLDEIPMPKEKVKRPRKTKELPPPVCEVQAISDEDVYIED